jgi:FMN reductase
MGMMNEPITQTLSLDPTTAAAAGETHRVVAVVGDARAHSRTAALASAVAVRLTRELLGGSRPDSTWRMIELGGTDAAGWEHPTERDLESLAAADVAVIASPVRRGSYAGLLKVFLDALTDRALAGSIAIPVMVGQTRGHALAADVHLRPLLVELGASCPTPSLFALEARLSNPGAVAGAWFERARPALSHLAAA